MTVSTCVLVGRIGQDDRDFFLQEKRRIRCQKKWKGWVARSKERAMGRQSQTFWLRILQRIECRLQKARVSTHIAVATCAENFAFQNV